MKCGFGSLAQGKVSAADFHVKHARTQDVAMEDCCRGGVMTMVTLVTYISVVHTVHTKVCKQHQQNMPRFAGLVAVLSHWTTHRLGLKDAVVPIYLVVSACSIKRLLLFMTRTSHSFDKRLAGELTVTAC